MNIQLTNIEYDLEDATTNPDNILTNEDLNLPHELFITSSDIDNAFGDDFDIDRDLAEMIMVQTGFAPTSYISVIV